MYIKLSINNYGYGYLNAIPAHHPALIEMYRAYNNNDWVWAPYYSIHKQLAGLIDIATYFDDKKIADKACLLQKIWACGFGTDYIIEPLSALKALRKNEEQNREIGMRCGICT